MWSFRACLRTRQGIVLSSTLCLAGDLFSDLLPVKLVSLY